MSDQCCRVAVRSVGAFAGFSYVEAFVPTVKHIEKPQPGISTLGPAAADCVYGLVSAGRNVFCWSEAKHQQTKSLEATAL